ncbi:efflux MFS transporter YdeE [Atlantibacter hermannii]|uniref:efflux MFS transporter YdeE n=1 Tax=Atlantibacter hermannii TaxID=565 RepID=UPI00289D4E06|nr:efflux MFS transporter YdeE [Atlantibacter hermannii]
MQPRHTLSIGALLASSVLLTIGRGATLPFMTIYLNRQYHMAVDQIGIAMSIALTVGVFFSLGFGILADRFEKKRYMLLAIAVFVSGFVAIPLTHNAALAVAWFSLVNCAYSVFATVLKSYFSETLTPSVKAKVFSLNYTFLNIGWTVGPPLGTWLLLYGVNMPFWLAAISSSIPFILIQCCVKPLHTQPDSGTEKRNTLGVLMQDRALIYFTLSAFLGSLVFGSFASCISQYVLVVADNRLAETVVGVVLPVNAAVVVSLQYVVGKRIRAENLRRLMLLGTVFFLMGLAGFMMSGGNLWLWGLSAAVFTFGELIYAPGEYMLVDNIAPNGLKASYFSAQSLGWLGGALNPLVTGVILTHLPPWSLFAILMVATAGAYLLMLKGMRAPRATATTTRCV